MRSPPWLRVVDCGIYDGAERLNLMIYLQHFTGDSKSYHQIKIEITQLYVELKKK